MPKPTPKPTSRPTRPQKGRSKSSATAKANAVAKSQKLLRDYLGKTLEATLDGRLFDHVPGTFAFRFEDPATLAETLQADYSDELGTWPFDTVVPVAAVSSAEATDYEFAWVFLDWRRGDKPGLVITTTDDWGHARTLSGLAALELEGAIAQPPAAKGLKEFQFVAKMAAFPVTATHVVLGNRGLTSLAPEIGFFARCTYLDLKKNKLTKLPPEMGLLKNLKELDVSGNPLTELPAELAQCTKLHKLEVEGTKLEALPFLPSLRILMAGNLNPSVLESICKMHGLEALHFNDCNVTELPEELKELKNLHFLNLGSNKLKKFPEWFTSLKKLKNLSTLKNPIPTNERKRVYAKMPWCYDAMQMLM